jgi:hypothetical protein
MADAAPPPPDSPGGPRPRPGSPRARLRLLGLLSVALFWVPLWAPLIQGLTLAETLRAAWRGSVDWPSVLAGAIGSTLGFLLFLGTQYLWVI